MNIPAILQTLSKNLNQNQQNNLIQAISKAKDALNLVKNPIETLAKNNVSVEFLDTLKTYVNNPSYDWIFTNLLKKDKNEVLRALEMAKQYLQQTNIDTKTVSTNPPNQNSSPCDDLDKFKRGLTRLK